MQTNATLLDQTWMAVAADHDLTISVSMDGPQEIHDKYRLTHARKGSYDSVVRGINFLHEAGIPLRILSVIQPGVDSLQIHRHFLELGAESIDYLLPDFTHDTVSSLKEKFGPTPCADYLLPVLDDWWRNGTIAVKIQIFWSMSLVILGGPSHIDYLGNRPFQFLFVESDGSIEGLDVLRICAPGMAGSRLNVQTNGFHEITSANQLHAAAIFDGMPLPAACGSCIESTTCAGGYLPHRYSEARGFDNPTVWCADMLRLFEHLRNLLQVSANETLLRRRILVDMGALRG